MRSTSDCLHSSTSIATDLARSPPPSGCTHCGANCGGKAHSEKTDLLCGAGFQPADRISSGPPAEGWRMRLQRSASSGNETNRMATPHPRGSTGIPFQKLHFFAQQLRVPAHVERPFPQFAPVVHGRDPPLGRRVLGLVLVV